MVMRKIKGKQAAGRGMMEIVRWFNVHASVFLARGAKQYADRLARHQK
jgi:hypothetical protein